MGISALSAVNSVNTKHSMSLSGRGPDWSIIPSSGKSSKSKAEFTDEIKELARRAANTTSKTELELSIGGGRNYVQSICLMCRPTGRRCTGRLKMR